MLFSQQQLNILLAFDHKILKAVVNLLWIVDVLNLHMA